MKKILVSRADFYTEIAENLTNAAVDVIKQAGYDFEIIKVPGVFELPASVAFAIASKKYAGYVALGCVIRGETTHYDYVCGESARGLGELSIQTNAAIGYGIITAENKAQANVRADKNQKNVGGRAAKACIDMIKIKEKMGI